MLLEGIASRQSRSPAHPNLHDSGARLASRNTPGQTPGMLGPDHGGALQLWPLPLAARRPLHQDTRSAPGAKTTTAAQSLQITGATGQTPASSLLHAVQVP